MTHGSHYVSLSGPPRRWRVYLDGRRLRWWRRPCPDLEQLLAPYTVTRLVWVLRLRHR